MICDLTWAHQIDNSAFSSLFESNCILIFNSSGPTFRRCSCVRFEIGIFLFPVKTKWMEKKNFSGQISYVLLILWIFFLFINCLCYSSVVKESRNLICFCCCCCSFSNLFWYIGKVRSSALSFSMILPTSRTDFIFSIVRK